MLFPLLRDEVLLCDLQLFFVGIAGKLDDLHAVEQGARDGGGSVCGGDEEHAGEVEGQLEEVIAEGAVLLPVQGLEQGRRRVAPVVGAQLVDLVQNHQGVAGARLDDAADDAARHGAYVGPPVAADLGFVVHAAEGDAHQLAVGRRGDALGDAGLAGPRRADQAQKPALYVRAQLPDGQVFQNALLDLVEAEVIVVQFLAGLLDVDGLLGRDAPGDLEAHVQITAQHGRLGGTEGLLGEPAQLLQELFAYLLGHRQGLDLLAVELDIVVLAQLRLDDLHLLAQIVVALVAVHGLLRLFAQFLLDAEDVELLRKQAVEQREAARRRQLLHQGLAILHAQAHVLREVVGDVGGVGIGEQVDDLLVDHVAVILDVLLKLRKAASEQSLLPLGGDAIGLVGQRHDIRAVALGVAVDVLGPCAVESLHHDAADAAARLAELLPDTADRADGVDLVLLGHVGRQILLGGQKDELVCAHGVTERRDGGGPLHVEGEEHARENMQAAQGEQGHFDQFVIFLGHECHLAVNGLCFFLLFYQLLRDRLPQIEALLPLVQDQRRSPVFDAVEGDDDLLRRLVGGDAVHGVGHDALHHASQAAGADLELDGPVRDGLQGLGIIAELHAVVGHQGLVLAGHGVFRLREDADQIVPAQAVKGRDDRESADELGDDAELQQIVLLDLGQDLPHVTLGPAGDVRAEAHGFFVGALLDDLVKAVERAAADEEDVRGVHVDKFLLGVLAPALRGNVGDGALEEF